ncbi:MAG: ATP-dependent helicase [Acidobacteria bacterium]|nr:MAG: ATP-dependent helicase [Acidobacteriota bacterium]TDI56290.1 MAG: ATP-dependent helicase [Acidobacteriota bacterium]
MRISDVMSGLAGRERCLSAMSRVTPSSEQQEILDLGLTTIRVRAGAGTGKTTTVAMVIANLIEDHDIQPEQILGITFTNKAAAELADRVRQALSQDLDPSRQIEVHTYHGFAAQILSEFGALAGVDNRSKIIAPTFARQLMSETFHHRTYKTLDITQPRTLDRVRRFGDRLGDHLLEATDVLDAAEDHDDEIWESRREMAETLVQFAADKLRLRVVDYSDLVTLSTRVVHDYPELADTIKERYRAVILDEYQDTNPAQRVLLMSIFDSGFPVIAVGDEDQTIYEWRGASAQNFELFTEHFTKANGEAASEKGLTLNRRSTQAILDVANEIRLEANAEADALRAVDGDSEGEVVTYWAEDALEEAEWIARTFEELQQSGSRWSDMAVLFRKNKDFAVVVDAMSRHDIPLEVANIGGLFSVAEVSDLRAWLTTLEYPEDSPALIQILFGSRYRLGMADLAPLTRWVAGAGDHDDAEEPAPITLMEAVENFADISGLRDEARSALLRFLRVYRDVLTESQGLTLVETCRTILDRTRAWQDIEALPPNARLTARLNIYRLLDLAEEWSPLRGRPSVGAFLDYLTVMEEEPAEELDAAHLSGEDAVTLVTVHRAKGLEWENVAIPAVTKGNFPTRSQQYPDPLRFAEHVPVSMRIDTIMDDLPDDKDERAVYLRVRHMRQEWRVAYVAVTRAKRRLFVSGAHWYGLPEPSKRPKEPSELFEIVENHVVSRSAGHAELGERPGMLRSVAREASPDPVFPDGWEAGLRAAIDDPAAIAEIAGAHGIGDEYERIVADINQRLFNLAEPAPEETVDDPHTVSVTGLVTYAQCPKRFFWTNIDPLPRRLNPAASRGTEVHRRIELHQKGQVPFEEMTDDLYDVVEGDRSSGPGAFDTYLTSRFAEKTATMTETPFSLELDTGYLVRGRIDAVYCDDSRWEVVDFKSGRPRTDPALVVQLQAYAVAATEVDFGLTKPKVLDVTFAYLGGGLTEVTHSADEQWVAEARKSLNALTGRISTSDFEENPGSWCNSCDFLQFCGPGQAEVEG